LLQLQLQQQQEEKEQQEQQEQKDDSNEVYECNVCDENRTPSFAAMAESL
jgi:hypothetical protein